MDSEPLPLPGGADDLERSLILADPRHRQVLSILLERSRPTTTRELGVRLAAREAGVEPAVITEADARPIRAELHHRYLPKLSGVGWIERRPGGYVADEPLAFEAGGMSLPDLRNPEHPSWEAVSALLARPYRQDLASVVADRDRRVDVTELAAELAERGWAGPSGKQPLATILHHVDLPKLAAVDLVEYDSGARTVVGTPRLRAVVDLTGLDAG